MSGSIIRKRVCQAGIVIVGVLFIATFVPGIVEFVFGVEEPDGDIGRQIRKLLLFPLLLFTWLGRRTFFKYE